MEIICKNLGELFQVQTEDHRNDAMEDLSHAFWQLLQTTGMKLLLTKEQVVSDLHKRVKSVLSLMIVAVFIMNSGKRRYSKAPKIEKGRRRYCCSY